MVLKNSKRGPGVPRMVNLGGVMTAVASIMGVAYIGTTGAGKTTLMNKLAKDAHRQGIPSIHLDLAGGMEDILRPLGGDVRIVDPVHQDGGWIRLAPLLATPLDRFRFAQALCPKSNGDEARFWDEVIAKIVHASIEILHHHAGRNGIDYTLADIVRLANRRQLLKLLGKAIPHVGDPYANIAGDTKLLANVTTSVEIHLAELSIVASLADHCTETVDLTDPWGATVIRWSDRHAPVLRPVFSFLFDTIIEQRLGADGHEDMLICLDELPSIGKIRSLLAASRRGRKHGLKIAVSFHEIGGMAEWMGSRDSAEELLGLFAYKIFVRQGSPMTAEWASRYLGMPTVVEDTPAPMWNKNADTQRHVHERPNFTPDELRRLPLPDYDRDDLRCVVDFPDRAGMVRSAMRADVAPPPARLTPRPPDQMILAPLNARDLERLNIPRTKENLDAL